MSRIGKQPINLPENTSVTLEKELIGVVGPKGTLQVPYLAGTKVTITDSVIDVTAETDATRAMQGLLRTLIQNAVTGVNTGWQKSLELHGVGMRAALTGNDLTMNLGFSHPVLVNAPEGITFQVVKNVITVSGIDKQLVGETAANIRKIRKPEPYKGKGIRYSDEEVRRKAGKTGKTK